MERQPLTDRQQEVFSYLVKFHREEDRLPTTREIQREFGFQSQTAAITHLKMLARKGRIENRSSIRGRSWWRFSKNDAAQRSEQQPTN